jgi:tetratricopeptide (TPR) repeat protein
MKLLTILAVFLVLGGVRPALAQGEGAALCALAFGAQREHLYESAIDSYTMCIDSGGLTVNQAAVAYYHRANAWRAVGDPERAILDYDEAIALEPNLALAYNGRGVTLAALGDIEGATSDLRDAIAIDPGLVEAYQNLGYVYWKAGDLEEAIKASDTALLLTPDDPQRYMNAALPRLDGRIDLEGALMLADAGIKLAPDIGSLHDLRGHVLALLGQQDEALAAFQTAMDISGAQLVGTYETSLAHQGYFEGAPDGEPDAEFVAALKACIAEACDLWAE